MTTIKHIHEQMDKYPTGIFGHKKVLLPHILPHIPRNFRSVAESFGGTGIVTAAIKRMGHRVITNDVMPFANLRLRALVANNRIFLDEDELSMLAQSTSTASSIIQAHYHEFFGETNAAFLDCWASNALKLDDPVKQDVAAFLPVVVISNAITHNRQVTSFSPTGVLTGNRHLQAVDLKNLTLEYGRTFPALLHDNGQINEVWNLDALDFVGQVKADVLYADPPYCCQAGKYEEKLHLYDKLSLILTGKGSEVRRFRNGIVNSKPHQDWIRRENAMVGFAELFRSSLHIPHLLISYNRDSEISPEEIAYLARGWGREVVIHGIPNYRRPTSMKGGKAVTEEVLIECT
jgi:adenine-specific DNA-methyltransferase